MNFSSFGWLSISYNMIVIFDEMSFYVIFIRINLKFLEFSVFWLAYLQGINIVFLLLGGAI